MTWTRLGDDFADKRQVADLTDSAFRLHVEALIQCNRLLNGGELARSGLRRLTPCQPETVDELVTAGLWDVIDEDTWQIDWTEQESAEVVRERRERNAERNKAYRRRKELHAAGDHSTCSPTHCPAAGVTGRVTHHVTNHETGPRPVPSRPVPKGQGQGAEGGSAGAPPPRPTGEKCPHGVVNGIRAGQCPDDECATEFEWLNDCARGICHMQTNGADRCQTSKCWLRDVWPAERDQVAS